MLESNPQSLDIKYEISSYNIPIIFRQKPYTDGSRLKKNKKYQTDSNNSWKCELNNSFTAELTAVKVLEPNCSTQQSLRKTASLPTSLTRTNYPDMNH